MLRIVSSENRATMQAYREGRSLEEYISEMWARRQAEHRGPEKAKGNWPCLIYSKPEKSNVTSISKARKGR